ncbi:MAG: hypothetical protein ACI31S_03550 [Bacilli bacterium]
MKVLIIGIVASGKSTLANRLGRENNIDVYEIDSIVHDDINNVKRSFKEQTNIIMNINKKNNWIIEGTLRKNLYFLLDVADKIIYIDIPIRIRKRRIITRYIKQKLKMENSNYKPTLDMIKKMNIWTYEFEKDKGVFEKNLNKYKKKLIILDSVKKVNNYKL